LELDSESQVKLPKPPSCFRKRFFLEKLYQNQRAGLRFRRRKLSCRSLLHDVVVAISATKIILKTPFGEELFDRADVTHLKRFLSANCVAKNCKAGWCSIELFPVIEDWFYSLFESLARKPS